MLPLRSGTDCGRNLKAELRMTDASSDKLSGDDCDAILTAIAKLGDRMERRSERWISVSMKIEQ